MNQSTFIYAPIYLLGESGLVYRGYINHGGNDQLLVAVKTGKGKYSDKSRAGESMRKC